MVRKTVRQKNTTEEKAVAALAYGLVANHLAVDGSALCLFASHVRLSAGTSWLTGLSFTTRTREETHD
jgi:hypothetical protein